jgi:2-oxoglutarate dehydrogenase E2 component (dihydrolipoamide succinyltransferase)
VLADFIEFDTEGKVEAKAQPEETPKQAEPTKEVPKIQKEEIKQAPQVPTTPTPAPQLKPQPTPPPKKEEPKQATISPTFTGGSRNQKREPISRMRQRIAERLKGSQNTYATLTTFNEVDMSEVMNLRNKYQEEFTKKYGVKLGFMSFFLKASTMALMENPVVNAVIDGEEIVYRDFIDISVAVATPTGLMVPVLRNCETKSLSDFEISLRDLSVLAKENKIKIEDMVGGTFTISNGGVYGSMLGTPIINPPQSAILGMHNIVNRPVCRGDDIVARPMM